MTKCEKISIIVAVYNLEKYIIRCVESLLSQNYESYEIIIVDDGSTDKTAELIGMLCQKNPEKIKLLRQEHRGLSVARNIGISASCGSLIIFVDGDDYLEKNALSALERAITRNGADIAVAGFFEEHSEYSRKISVGEGTLEFPDIIRRMSERDGYKLVVVWGKIYRRELFSTVRFPEGRLHEDQYIIHELYYRSGRTVAVNMHLYHHENRKGGISRHQDFGAHTDDLDALLLRCDFLKRVGYSGCIAYVAWHMLRLLDYYLDSTLRPRSNRKKCKYLKLLLSLAERTEGKDSELYRRCASLYRKSYVKYKMLSCLFG